MSEAKRLRAFLADGGITQASFARHMDVSLGAVAQWLSGARPVPGPVLAYLKLFARLPPSMQQTERFSMFMEGQLSMEGMYLVHYVGQGQGFATLTLQDGIIYGYDQSGGTYDGVYKAGQQAMTDIEVSVKMPAHVPSVVGGVVQPFDWTLVVRATIRNHSQEQVVDVHTNLGPTIQASIKKMRDLPQAA